MNVLLGPAAAEGEPRLLPAPAPQAPVRTLVRGRVHGEACSASPFLRQNQNPQAFCHCQHPSRCCFWPRRRRGSLRHTGFAVSPAQAAQPGGERSKPGDPSWVRARWRGLRWLHVQRRRRRNPSPAVVISPAHCKRSTASFGQTRTHQSNEILTNNGSYASSFP